MLIQWNWLKKDVLFTLHFRFSFVLIFLLFFQEIEMFAEVKLELQAVTQTNMEKFSHLEAFSYIQTLEKFKRL